MLASGLRWIYVGNILLTKGCMEFTNSQNTQKNSTETHNGNKLLSSYVSPSTWKYKYIYLYIDWNNLTVTRISHQVKLLQTWWLMHRKYELGLPIGIHNDIWKNTKNLPHVTMRLTIRPFLSTFSNCASLHNSDARLRDPDPCPHPSYDAQTSKFLRASLLGFTRWTFLSVTL